MQGQFIVLDKEKKVVVVMSDSEVIVNDEYQVIFDQKEEYRFVDYGNGLIGVVNGKTPQDVLDQGECVEMSVPKAKGSFNKLAELGIDLSALL